MVSWMQEGGQVSPLMLDVVILCGSPLCFPLHLTLLDCRLEYLMPQTVPGKEGIC